MSFGNRDRFSRRHGLHASGPEPEITVRNDAPPGLREAVQVIAYETELLRPSYLRDIVCKALRALPDTENWSEYPNIQREVRYLIDGCEWFLVYDIIEAIYADLVRRDGLRAESSANYFAEEINAYFRQNGIGWQLVDGRIEVRGSEPFGVAVVAATEALGALGKDTARTQIHEALADLSRRPKADVTGAIQHAMAAMECVARDAAGDQKATFGEIMKARPDLLPPPLDQAAAKVWGYASEMGRHLRDGREPGFDEAELAVVVASGVITYLVKRLGS